MSNQSNGRKISKFLQATSVTSGAKFTYIVNNTNYSILDTDFYAALGVTGTIVQDGAVTGTPILDTAGTVNNIRNLEPGSGIKTSVSAENGVTIEQDFIEDTAGVTLVEDLTADQPNFRSIVAGTGVNVSGSGGEIQIALSAIPAGTKTVIVNDINDFPAAVAGVITLADETEYAIRNDITTASRFVLGDNCVISGADNIITKLTYSNSGVMFTSLNQSWSVSNITLSCTSGTFVDFDGSGIELFQMRNSAVIADTLGTIDDVYGIHFDDTQFTVTTDGFLFGGTNGVILLEANLSVIDAGTLWDLGTATFSGFSITDAFATLNGSSVFLDGAASSANITSGNIGSIHNSRFFGTGTPLNTIAVGDIRWVFDLNNGIKDSTVDVLMSQVSNATDTVIATVNTPVKVAGTWNEEDAFSFTTDATGKMTYVGEKDIELNVSMSFTIAPVSGTNKNLAAYVALNGTEITNSGAPAVIVSATNFQRVSTSWRVSLSPNDYIEGFAENRTDAVDILITDAVKRISYCKKCPFYSRTGFTSLNHPRCWRKNA